MPGKTDLSFSKRGHLVSWGIASVFCALGDTGNTFDWLGRGLQAREVRISLVKAEPIWDEMRSDPRYLDVLKKMGLDR